MKFKVALCVAFAVLAVAEARHLSATRHRTRQLDDDGTDNVFQVIAGQQPHSAARRALSKQARVFPGAVSIKKLVLLKFKKILPISLVLLRSSNENEPELVPVYPTSEIPANVQFIPTPNGISGHKDVQAIAIPNELHEQLEASGHTNIEDIEALLNQAAEVPSDDESTASVVDEPLKVSESDVGQLLEGIGATKNSKAVKASPVTTVVRRLTADGISRPASHGLSANQETHIEEIPLFLYSAKDDPIRHNNARITGLRLVTSNGAARRELHS